MLGIRRTARKALRRIRRFNRWWIDRLDPSPPEPEPVASSVEDPPVAEPVAHAAHPASIRKEATPNPDAVKFVADRRVVPSGSLSFSNARAAEGHPLGRALFAIEGVKSLFAINDFVTVTRRSSADWDELAPRIEAVLADQLGDA